MANNKIDRLIAIGILSYPIIAHEYKRITYDSHAMEIHGWVKELDPTYDHEGPKTYDDYQEICNFFCLYFIFYIVKEYIIESRTINRIHCATRSIDKIIELS